MSAARMPPRPSSCRNGSPEATRTCLPAIATSTETFGLSQASSHVSSGNGPPGIGEGTLAQETRNDPVRDQTLQLFGSLPFHGLGYLELKRDQRDGQYYVIEANVGRPTGRSSLAEAGGVELLYAQYCDAVGLPLPTSLTQGHGSVKWVYLRAELRAGLHYWSKGELTLRDWLRSLRGPKVFAVFSWRDPLLFWSELGQWLMTRVAGRKSG